MECAGAFPLTTFLGVCSAEVSSEYCLLIGAKLREKEQGSSAMLKSIHRIFFLITPLSVVAIGVSTTARNAWQQEPSAQPGRDHYSRVGVAIARQKPLGIRRYRPFRRERSSACGVGGNRAEPEGDQCAGSEPAEGPTGDSNSRNRCRALVSRRHPCVWAATWSLPCGGRRASASKTGNCRT